MKTKTFYSIMLTVGLFAFAATALRAQVGINKTGATPNASAVLDLNTGSTGTMGFLPPQVALASVSSAAPVTSPATGLIVYSTTAPTGGDGVGYYYWTGTAWAFLGSSVSGSGTDNYVARWTPNGNALGIGSIRDNDTGVAIDTTPHPDYALFVNSGIYNQIGIVGYNNASEGIASAGLAVGSGGIGLFGYNAAGQGQGVEGEAPYIGVAGYADTIGVYAEADTAITAYGSYDGIRAYGTGHWGVYAEGIGGVIGYGDEIGVLGKDTIGDEALLAYELEGMGVYSYGVNIGVYSVALDAGSTGAGVYGEDNHNIGVEGFTAGRNQYGVLGEGDGYGAYGVYGTSDSDIGVEGINTEGDGGIGVYAVSTDATPLFAQFNYNIATEGAAITTYNALTGDEDYVNYYNGTTAYKIEGVGTVSTIVKNTNGERVVLHCPETPEIYFEDYGEGQLVNGKAHINLDKDLALNVTINDKHPLRVFIQLEENENCKGVVTKNKTASGFDVVELGGGTSNTPFEWHIVCNRADETFDNGRVSRNADIRFEKAPAKNAYAKASQLKKRAAGVTHAGKAVAKLPLLTANAHNKNRTKHVIPLKVKPLTSTQSQNKN